MATNSRAAQSSAAAAADTNLEDRAKKSGLDVNAKEEVDDMNPERRFSFQYKPYLEPKDLDSVEETVAVDAENKRRFEFNSTQTPLIQHALKRMACNWKIPKPPIYSDRAKQLFLQVSYAPRGWSALRSHPIAEDQRACVQDTRGRQVLPQARQDALS
jgi:hypothetical protein